MSAVLSSAIDVLFPKEMSKEEGENILKEIGFDNPPFRIFLGYPTFVIRIPKGEWTKWGMLFQRHGVINAQLTCLDMI